MDSAHFLFTLILNIAWDMKFDEHVTFCHISYNDIMLRNQLNRKLIVNSKIYFILFDSLLVKELNQPNV